MSRQSTIIPRVFTKIHFDWWTIERPKTHHWGSGDLFNQLAGAFGKPDVAFGKTDGIPNGVVAIDRNTGYEWAKLPFPDNHFAFGYWDPPYDSLYKKEGMEIWRTCQKLAILHTHIWPRSWLKDAKRIALIAVSMGPMKQLRCLQIFGKMGVAQSGSMSFGSGSLRLDENSPPIPKETIAI